MLQYVYDNDVIVAQFIAKRLNRDTRTFGRYKTIGVLDEEGRLIGGVVYLNYDRAAGVIEMGLAAVSPRFFNRETFRRMFEYVFIGAKCQMLFTRVRAGNEHLLSQMARLNFNLTLIPRMYGREEDGVIGTLTDDQWLDSKLARRVYRDVTRKEQAA